MASAAPLLLNVALLALLAACVAVAADKPITLKVVGHQEPANTLDCLAAEAAEHAKLSGSHARLFRTLAQTCSNRYYDTEKTPRQNTDFVACVNNVLLHRYRVSSAISREVLDACTLQAQLAWSINH